MKQKRPFWVWVIFLFTLFGIIFSAYSLYLIKSGSFPLDETTRDYFDSMGMVDWSSAIVATALSLAAGVSFFLLKKISVDLFLAGLVLMVVNYAYSIFATTWLEVVGTPTMISAIAGFGISIIIYMYARSLRKKGILT